MTKQFYEQWPLGRHTIGFNQIFDALQSTANTASYPPYNIWQLDDATYKIEIALAGFAKKDISITQDGNLLTVAGDVELIESAESATQQRILHKGISTKRFERQFHLAEHVVVDDAKMKNGMLVITCKVVIPEELQPKVIDIS